MSEPVDHLALASEWAMVVDEYVRNCEYEKHVDGDPDDQPGLSNQRHIAYMHSAATLHAQIAAAQAMAAQGTVSVSVAGDMITGEGSGEGGLRRVAGEGDRAGHG